MAEVMMEMSKNRPRAANQAESELKRLRLKEAGFGSSLPLNFKNGIFILFFFVNDELQCAGPSPRRMAVQIEVFDRHAERHLLQPA